MEWLGAEAGGSTRCPRLGTLGEGPPVEDERKQAGCLLSAVMRATFPASPTQAACAYDAAQAWITCRLDNELPSPQHILDEGVRVVQILLGAHVPAGQRQHSAGSISTKVRACCLGDAAWRTHGKHNRAKCARPLQHCSMLDADQCQVPIVCSSSSPPSHLALFQSMVS